MQVLHGVFPLFEGPRGAHLSWGMECPVPGGPNYGWDLRNPDLAQQLIALMHEVVVPTTAHVTNGRAFLGYLDGHSACSGWVDWARALGFIHMGNLDAARDLITPLAHIMLDRFPHIAVEGAWGHSMIEMLRLINDDPGAVPDHCEAVARKAVTINKLEKFWEPTPFVYDARRSKP